LTEAVRKAPHSVVLLDELEKAHPDVLNVLLQILEDGMLTDGKGRTVNFKNVILIMTSNVGSQRILALSKLESAVQKSSEPNGGADSEQGAADVLYAKLSDIVKDELEQTMRPELLNRMDEIVVFSPLSGTDLRGIAKLIMDKVVERAQEEQELTLTVTPAFIKAVTDEGSSNAAQFGARPMRRAAQRFFEDAVSDSIVRGFLERGDDAVVDLKTDLETDRHYVVEVCRSRDSNTVEVLIDKVVGGIGTPSGAGQPANLEETNEGENGSFETERRKKKKRPVADEFETESSRVE
jgi:ATP-dependent Clp protease ATP-binding subunit ClpC